MTVERLTARGPGAVAVVEVGGDRAVARLAALVGRPLPRPGGLSLARLRRGTELLDEALVVCVDALRFEVHLHGGPAVVARVMGELGIERHAPRRRGIAERAERAAPHAPSEDGARILLDQAAGALERELVRLCDLRGEEAMAATAALARAGRGAQRLLEAPRVVLAGPVNAGKSTLFNLLVGSERALVSERAGTTRDAVLERVRLGALAVDLIDTAGERELDRAGAAGEVERAGQDLAVELQRRADLVLWLSAGPGADLRPTPEVSVVELRRTPGGTHAEPDRGVVAALEDPAGSRALVERLVAGALPFEGWVPGRAVPFESGQVAALERAAPIEDDARRAAALRTLLEPAQPSDEGRRPER